MRWVIFVGCLAVLTGCNAIFGLDEPTLGDTTAGSGASGQGGGGAAGASGGEGGAGAEAGAGGGPVPCTPDCTEGCFEEVCGGHHVVNFAPGEQVNCVRLQSGSVWCWGNDRFGAVGNGVGSPDSCLTKAGGMMVPCALQAERLDLPGPAVAVSTGWHAACAILQTGDLYCWGRNVEGQLGHAPNTDGDVECEPGAYCKPSPHLVEIPGMPDVSGVQMGLSFACAGGPDGSITCWGANHVGQTGIDESGTEVVAPGTLVGGLNGSGMAVSLYGDTHVCAARTSGLHLACWGSNNQGQLGIDPNKECSPGQYCETHPVEPAQGPVLLTTNTFMAPARRVTCVVTNDPTGNVQCVGFDGLGMMGTPPSPWPPSPHPTFTPIPFFENITVTQITGNHMHYCALTNNGSVFCWGVNQFGELGSGTVGDGESGACGDFGTTFPCYATPQPADGLRDIEGIRTSGYITMALKEGQVYAWGVNQSGQLGHDPGTQGDVLCVGETGDSLYCNPTPALVANLPGPDPR